ncbi:MAG TPA: TetR/AcrR family transcriptional regulator [Spirochaetota bacterium]|nr:TetR/AcrR family transcriptional regulator [Spirochaetota bacterium]HPG51405.1 TetR/AcrR family transcriptional regulator [Spirochaetota bacterium]HPN11559.1 TetR/AcrR family transcriptional regulator [Spirochaetota bacterium]HQL82476.1 TetR/AcrR family transcriptional regulator [Spirochaetota bacterium]
MADMSFQEFSGRVMVSVEELCRDYYRENRDLIRVKKEDVAVRNLVTIVNATIKLSCRMGFDAMSLRDLSRESGLSMGALYSYFSSKEDLLSIIQCHGQSAVERILRDNTRQESDTAVKLRNVIRTHLYLSELMSQWFYFFFMETKNLNKKYQKISVESELLTERIITDILDEGAKNGMFIIDNIQLTGSVIKAMMQDWYLKKWKYKQRNVSVETYAQFIIDVTESFIMKKT